MFCHAYRLSIRHVPVFDHLNPHLLMHSTGAFNGSTSIVHTPLLSFDFTVKPSLSYRDQKPWRLALQLQLGSLVSVLPTYCLFARSPSCDLVIITTALWLSKLKDVLQFHDIISVVFSPSVMQAPSLVLVPSRLVPGRMSDIWGIGYRKRPV